MILEVDGVIITEVDDYDRIKAHPNLLSNPINWAIYGLEKEVSGIIELFRWHNDQKQCEVVGAKYKRLERW